MPQRFHLQRPDLATAVTMALRGGNDVRSHQRLLAMRLAASGQFTAAQIAGQIGVSRRQFFHWVNALKAGGGSRLLERDHGGGRPAQVHGSALAELQAGLKEGRWKRAQEIQAWPHQRHETRLTVKGGYYWLGKLGGVLTGPRTTHTAQRRGRRRRVSTDAGRTAQELERGGGQAGARGGGR